MKIYSLHTQKDLKIKLHAMARKVLKEEKVDLSVLDDEETASSALELSCPRKT